ncbi:hypothetical protein D3C78_1782360 [compost metagenome]
MAIRLIVAIRPMEASAASNTVAMLSEAPQTTMARTAQRIRVTPRRFAPPR